MRQAYFKLAAALVATVSAAALAPTAHAGVVISWSGTTAIPGNNDFQSALNTNYGLTRYASTGLTALTLQSDSIITFYFLGSESGASDAFTTVGGTPNVSCSESTNGIINNFPSGVLCGTGSSFFAAQSLLDNFLFTGGTAAGPQSAGFGVFLTAAQVSGSAVNQFFLGYDDNGSDDNHDDFIIRAVVTPTGVPEPATWAMMLVGFGFLGAAMRRKNQSVRASIRFA